MDIIKSDGEDAACHENEWKRRLEIPSNLHSFLAIAMDLWYYCICISMYFC